MMPEDFMTEMRGLLGAEEYVRFEAAMSEPPSVAVRLNPAKPADLPAVLEGEPVEWWAASRRLASRPSFTLMPLLHAGAFYVQDPSSMIVAEVVSRLCNGSGAPLAVLDACAAPGGKTTALIDALPHGSLVVANEFDARRAAILVENLTKWGSPDTIVTCGDTDRYSGLRDAFDIIVIDAPCSGEGMMRKDETARSQWSPGLVRQCAALQKEIIDNLWGALRPGGFLIYSTCTFNLQEDERQVSRVIEEYGAESLDLSLPAEWGIGASRMAGVHALRFMPHLTDGEGLFLSVMRKPDDGGEAARQKPLKKKKQKGGRKQKPPFDVAGWLTDAADYSPVSPADDVWCAVRSAWLPLYRRICEECKVIKSGVELCVVKGKDLIPSHALALCPELDANLFPAVELTEERALAYLRREPVTLPDAPRGYLLVKFGGLPLGFLKNLGNRSNNLYPSAWRIRISS